PFSTKDKPSPKESLSPKKTEAPLSPVLSSFPSFSISELGSPGSFHSPPSPGWGNAWVLLLCLASRRGRVSLRSTKRERLKVSASFLTFPLSGPQDFLENKRAFFPVRRGVPEARGRGEVLRLSSLCPSPDRWNSWNKRERSTLSGEGGP